MPDVWLVLWAVCLALLAGLFGGVAGGVTWWLGRASGTGLGRRAVANLERTLDTGFSRLTTGFLIGATDGLVLATAVIVGLFLLDPGRTLLASAEFRLASLLLAFGLGAAAIFLGSIAHLLVWARDSSGYAVGGFVFAFFAVALLAGRYRFGDPLLLGLLAGIVAGPLTVLVSKRRAVNESPRVRRANEPEG
jgi:hypothetical protein